MSANEAWVWVVGIIVGGMTLTAIARAIFDRGPWDESDEPEDDDPQEQP